MPYRTINVTQAELDRAEREDSHLCAVQQAIARQLPNAAKIDVDVNTIRFTMDGERHVYVTPWRVGRYVVAFDAGDHCAPFKFQLRGEHRLIGTATHRRTEHGKSIDRARDKQRKARRKVTKMEAAKDAGAASAAAVKRARTELAATESELADLRSSGAGPQTERTSEGKRKAPGRVFVGRTKQRTYGRRILRENQGPGPLRQE